MKILIIGHKGYLGSYLFRKFSECGFKVDTFQDDKRYDLVRVINNDIVINCAGLVSVKDCDTYPNISYDQNLSLPIKIVDDLRKYRKNAKYYHMSSYYLYNKIENVPQSIQFINNSNPNYSNNYMIHKRDAERVALLYKNSTILRLGKLIGNYNHNVRNRFDEKFIIKSVCKEENVYCDDVMFNPTPCQFVFEILLQDICNKFNVLQEIENVGLDTISHYDFALKVCDVVGLNKNYIKHIEKRSDQFDGYGKFAMSVENLKRSLIWNNVKLKSLENYILEPQGGSCGV